MQCTTQEIAEKRRLAQERLQKLKLNKNTTNQQPAAQTNPSNGTVKSPTSSFYGNKPNVKTVELSEYENKIKNAPSYRTANRILSQPYSMRNNQSNANGSTSSSAAAASNNNNIIMSAKVTCTCAMVNANCFEVVPSAYHDKLISVFKTIPSRNYDSQTRIWSFNLSDYDLVRERVGRLNPEVVMGVLPKFVLNLLRSEKVELDFVCLQAIERKLGSQLLEFQKIGVAFGIAHGGRCLIADDMGLGKTFQALAIADFYKDDWPLLVVTTATARGAWEDHFHEWLPWIPKHLIKCLTSNQDYVGDAKVIITSYSMMDKNCDSLLDKNIGFVILDESHTVKNHKTKSAQSAIRLGEKAKRIVLLTGTPALSRPNELYTQLALIDKKFFGSFKEYAIRYCNGHQNTFGLDSSGQSNLKELNVVLSRKFMIRRTKDEVQFELGAKTRETILLDPSSIWNATDEKTRETVENMEEYSKDIDKLKGLQRDEVLLRFYAETAKLKVNAVCAYVKELLPEKKKFIVFCHHKVMLNGLSSCLTKQKVDFILIDGTTRNDLRNSYIERFQNNKKCQVAVLSLKACNAAITLTAASLVIFGELDWNPSTLAQCESRAHRIGQDKPVVCRYLLAKGTADDYIWNMVKKKQNVLNSAGLFSEDLGDATHSTASIPEANQLTQYFVDPKQSKSNEQADGAGPSTSHAEVQQMETSKDEDDLKRLLEDDEDDAALLALDYGKKQFLEDDDGDAFLLDLDF